MLCSAEIASSATTPLSVLAGTTLASYSVWQLAFSPFRGPLPGRILPLAVLCAETIAGVGLMAWGLDRLGLLRRP